MDRNTAGRVRSLFATLGFHVGLVVVLGMWVDRVRSTRDGREGAVTPDSRAERISRVILAPRSSEPVVAASRAQTQGAKAGSRSASSAVPRQFRPNTASGLGEADARVVEPATRGAASVERPPSPPLITNALGEHIDRRLMLPTAQFANRRTEGSLLDSMRTAGLGRVMNSISTAVSAEIARATIKTMVTTGRGRKFGFDGGGLHIGQFNIGLQIGNANRGSNAQRINTAREDIDRIERRTKGDAAFKASLPRRVSSPDIIPPTKTPPSK